MNKLTNFFEKNALLLTITLFIVWRVYKSFKVRRENQIKKSINDQSIHNLQLEEKKLMMEIELLNTMNKDISKEVSNSKILDVQENVGGASSDNDDEG